jgi:diguanylate cyclase
VGGTLERTAVGLSETPRRLTLARIRRSGFYRDLSRYWLDAPSVGGIRPLQITTGGLYIAGGFLGLLGAATLPGGSISRGPITLIGLLALVVGAITMVIGDRFPRALYHLSVSLGTILITAVVMLAGGGAPSVTFSMVYLFVIIDAIFLFSLRIALLQIAFCAAMWIFSLAWVGDSPGDIAVNLGAAVVVAVVVGWLTRVAHQAEVDSLTHLLNRRGFDRRVEEELARFHRAGEHLTVIVLDVDYFKTINDQGGHTVGDQLLMACSRAWSNALPEGALLARYGSDEFAVLLTGWGLGPAGDLADELRALAPTGITVSSGVAAAMAHDSGSMLVSRADVALYEAKSSGRDRTVVHGDPLRSASELENAIAAGQFELHFQPIVQLSTDEVVVHEALVRWRHPTKGMILPNHFVPQAELTGAIHSLGTWVMEETARILTTGSLARGRAGINISIAELRTDTYVDRMADLLGRWDMAGGRLIAEVTESVFDDGDPRILENLHGLRALGISIAIDDFGAGYSSLRRIEELPIDLIKVDGALIQGIKPDSYDAPILEAIITMGRSLGVRLIAEHVETAHQAAVLRRLGYDLVQGYLFGRPLPR